MPVLSIGGEKSLGKELGEQAKLVADNPTVIVLPNAGHWILEEKPKETTDALLRNSKWTKVARRAFNSRRCRRTDRPAAGIKKRKIELDYIPTGLYDKHNESHHQ